MSGPLARAFSQQASQHLAEDFLPKVRRCLEILSEEEIWWRAHENTNSVGNLVLHLCGNVQQWIISGLGQQPDTRHRDAEFSQRRPIPRDRLIQTLERAVKEAVRVLDSLEENDLLSRQSIQSYDVTGLQAIFHVVEHFSYHSGQIIYITRMKKNLDLKFYQL
jgi:uncharacterized damage-inducible protein DinB